MSKGRTWSTRRILDGRPARSDAVKCTCPTKFDDHSHAIVRASLDQFCPIHGVQKQELPHCATCACAEVPIVQTTEVAAQIARAAAEQDGERSE